MKIFSTTLEIQPVAPILGQNVSDEPQRSAVRLEIKLLHSSPPEFDLVLDTWAEATAAIAAVERFICRAARTNCPLHLLPL